jgi:hypothetical protein
MLYFITGALTAIICLCAGLYFGHRLKEGKPPLPAITECIPEPAEERNPPGPISPARMRKKLRDEREIV